MKALLLVVVLSGCGVEPEPACVDMTIRCDLDTHCLYLCDMGTWETVKCVQCGEPGTVALSGRYLCEVPRYACEADAGVSGVEL